MDKENPPRKQQPAAESPLTAARKPKTLQMVINALEHLAEPRGSSAIAIKKFLAVTYDMDLKKNRTTINRCLKKGLIDGHLVQSKGSGVAGSFKLPKMKKPPVVNKKPKAKPVEPAKPKATAKLTAVVAVKIPITASKTQLKKSDTKTKKPANPTAGKKTAEPVTPKKITKAAPKAVTVVSPTPPFKNPKSTANKNGGHLKTPKATLTKSPKRRSVKPKVIKRKAK